MLRYWLLKLSQNRRLRQWFEQGLPSKRLTARFIAGRSVEDALTAVHGLKENGMLAAADYLGENVTRSEDAESSRDRYLDLLERLAALDAGATISLKLTQFGLDLSQPLCVRNLTAVAGEARRLGTRVEIDMEGSAYTERTLDIIRQVHAIHPGCIRAVLQAYLYRTEQDARDLSGAGIPIRLCKGAYREPCAIAYQKKSEVDASYVRLLHFLLQSGTYPAIASHDETIVREAVSFSREHSIPPDRFEFEMLYGIRRDLQRELASAGFRLRIYVPFGDAWYPYFVRRLAERPANLLFLLKNLFHS